MGRELRSGVKCIVVTIVTGSLWLLWRYRWGQLFKDNFNDTVTLITTIHFTPEHVPAWNVSLWLLWRYRWGQVYFNTIPTIGHTNHGEPVTIVKTIHFTPERSSQPVSQAQVLFTAFVVENQMLLHSGNMYTCPLGLCAIKCLSGLQWQLGIFLCNCCNYF